MAARLRVPKSRKDLGRLLMFRSSRRDARNRLRHELSAKSPATSITVNPARAAMTDRMTDWTPDLSRERQARAISPSPSPSRTTSRAGRLAPGDRLPPQRELAARLDIDFTTVARGYVEAGKRGLMESRVGQRHLRAAQARPRARRAPAPRRSRADFTHEHAAGARRSRSCSRGCARASRRRRGSRSRCCAIRASAARRPTATRRPAWLGRRALVPAQERIFSRPGAHRRMVGIFSMLARPGDDRAVRERSPIPASARSPRSSALQPGRRCRWTATASIREALGDACRRCAEGDLSQPDAAEPDHDDDSRTSPRARSCEIARRSSVPIVEDDAYGFIPAHGHGHAPFAAIAPDI